MHTLKIFRLSTRLITFIKYPFSTRRFMEPEQKDKPQDQEAPLKPTAPLATQVKPV